MTKEAFGQLLNHYQDMVYRIALNYTKNSADAQDISQETFLRLYRREIGFDSEEAQRAWLIRVTINLSKNLLRSKWHHIMQEEYQPDQLFCDGPDCFPQYYTVTEAMGRLSKSDRMILHLYYYEEYDTAAISRILKIKEPAVRKRLSRARKRLAIQLKEEFSYEEIPLDSPLSKRTESDTYAS